MTQPPPVSFLSEPSLALAKPSAAPQLPSSQAAASGFQSEGQAFDIYIKTVFWSVTAFSGAAFLEEEVILFLQVVFPPFLPQGHKKTLMASSLDAFSGGFEYGETTFGQLE